MSLSDKPWATNRKEFLTDLEKVRTLVSIFVKFGNPLAEVEAEEISVLGEWINIRESEAVSYTHLTLPTIYSV